MATSYNKNPSITRNFATIKQKSRSDFCSSSFASLTPIKQIISEHRKELREKYKVRKIGIFGSYARGEQKETSDIDILVEFEEGYKNFDNFMNLYYYLKDIFKTDIDLLTKESISKHLKNEILSEVEYIEG
jgi:predicted nucleotidyltransferase